MALPYGPGFRLPRNHAEGAFPLFGFNSITQGQRPPSRGKPYRLSKAVSGFGLGRHGRPMMRLGLSVRFDRQADQRREARTIDRRPCGGTWCN